MGNGDNIDGNPAEPDMHDIGILITGPATKFTNPGALKMVMGIRRFLLYLAFVMVFSFVTGIIVSLITG